MQIYKTGIRAMNPVDSKQYFSDRDIPLVYYGRPPTHPTITVENYLKWYKLYVIHPNGLVTSLEFPWEEDLSDVGESTVGDHVVNPRAVVRFADRHNFVVDAEALEMLTGRWVIEAECRYEDKW